ncbi:DNA replication initiation factor cdc45 [Apiospora marii]|uniref:DNA replication initiation factor cdc45 n=1 Tax=Apiospora marii TaxID=335849 RepID=A0ABR1SA35_9PEZI
MGIPGLSAALRPYGKATTLSGQSVVIDGPALVHRIWEAVMAQQSLESATLGHVPYAVLGEGFVNWLNLLHAGNVKVKWATRRGRLIRSTKTMTDTSSYMSSGVSRPRGNTPFSSNITLADLGRAGTGSTRRFPKHPFLVPAVAELVRNSRAWRDVVQVVPGEADTYCAEDIRQNGGIVLTSDSDLLMEDLGPHGSVAFFWEIGTKSETEETDLFALTYSARQLAEQLGLQDAGGIPRLAFEMTTRHTGLDEALHFAKASDTTEEITKENYQKFLEEHLVPQEYISADHPVISLLTSLDPRISELVIQSLNIDLATDAESSASTDIVTATGQPRGPDKTSMFLPVMVEDNARKSSWTTSESVRQLCYAIAQQHKKKEGPHGGPEQPPRRDDVVIEYRTLESPTGGRQMSLPSPAETESGCAELLATLEQIELGLPGRELLWLALAVYQDVDWSTSNGRHPLSVQVMGEAATLFLNPENSDGQGQQQQQQPGQYGWDVLHFTAQVQTSLYSLRMLQQVLDIVSALDDSPLSQTQEKLQQRLSNLPLIANWPTAESIFGQLSRIQRTGCLSVISKMLDIAEFEFKAPSKNRTSQNNQKKGQSSRKMPPRSLAVNPFAVLSPQAQEE